MRGVIFEGLESRVLLNAELGIPPPPDPSLAPALDGSLVDPGAGGFELFAVIVAPSVDGPEDGTDEDDEFENSSTNNQLDGMAGDDRYQFADGWGDDEVTDTGTAGHDTLDFSAVTTALTFTIQIDAGELVVEVTDGTSTVTARGIEHLVGGQGDDEFVIEGDANLTGSIRGGDGDDTLTYVNRAGGATVDFATGEATGVGGGNTALAVGGVELANTDDDVAGPTTTLSVTGTREDDRLEAVEGSGTLTGGRGDDVYVFTNGWGTNAVVDGEDQGTDTLDFSAVTGDLRFARVVGGSGWNVDLIDGGVPDPEFHVTASGIDVLAGGSGDDSFTGDGADIVYRFADGWGSDTVTGGTGEDTLDFSRVTANLEFLIGPDGTVTVTDLDDPTNVLANATSVEHLIGGSGDNEFVMQVGAALTGTIRGNDTGRNTLDYRAWQDDVVVNLALRSATGVGTGNDSAFDIQHVIGGDGADQLTGDDADNELTGGLEPGDGNDILRGGGGDDLLVGGEGDDEYHGDAGNDTVSFAAATGTVDANLTTGIANGQGTDEQLDDIENLTGSSADDVLTGNAEDNVFIGGGGADQIFGGDGVTAGVIDGIDTIDYRAAPAAVVVDLSSGSATIGADPAHTLQSIENVIGTGYARGDGFGDEITGNASPNRIFVAAGPDPTSVSGGVTPGPGDELVVDARGRLLAGADGASINLAGAALVNHGGFEAVRVNNTLTAIEAAGMQQLGEGLRELADRIAELESSEAFGLGLPLADAEGTSFGALLGFSRVLHRLADDFDDEFQDGGGDYEAGSTERLRGFFEDWAVDELKNDDDLEGTREWLARTLEFTDSLVLDPTTGAVTELAFTHRSTNERTTFMDLSESALLSGAGVFLEPGQGFELTSGFDLDLTFGLENWNATTETGSFFVDTGERFDVSAFASLRDELPVELDEIAARIGFMGGSVRDGAELMHLNASANADFAGVASRLTLQNLRDIETLFSVFNEDGSLDTDDLLFDTGAGLDSALAGDGQIGLDPDANFLDAALDVSLPGQTSGFTLATPAELLRMLGQLGQWLSSLGSSDVLDLAIPFAGNTTLGDVLGFGQAFGEEMLRYLVHHDGLRLGAETAETGRLTDDAGDDSIVTFTLALGTTTDEERVTVELRAGATAFNESAEDLRAQIEQALLDAAGTNRELAENVEVLLVEGRIAFRPLANQDDVTRVTLPRLGNQVLGYDGQRLVVPRSLIVEDVLGGDYIGVLGHDIEFTLNVDGQSVTVAVVRDSGNERLAEDPAVTGFDRLSLIGDIGAAVADALTAAGLSGAVTVELAAGTDDRIAFTAGAGVQQVLLTAVRDPMVLVAERLSLGLETATFPTAQLLADQLDHVLNDALGDAGVPVTVDFDTANSELTFTLEINRTFAPDPIELDLGVDLGDFVSIDTATSLGVVANVGLDLTFGVHLFPQQELVVAPPVFQPNLPEDGQLSGTAEFGFTLTQRNFAADQRLSSGGPGQLGVAAFELTAPDSDVVVWTAPADSRLENEQDEPLPDQHFFLRVSVSGEPDRFVAGVLLSHDTLNNDDIDDLAGQLASAMTVALASNGFEDMQVTAGAADADSIELSLSGPAGSTIALVTLDEFRVAALTGIDVELDTQNESIEDLVADVQAAIDAALSEAELGPVPDPLLGLDALNTQLGGIPLVGEIEVPDDGVLNRDVRFTVVANGQTVRGVVNAADTRTNASAAEGGIAALAGDVEAALNEALAGLGVSIDVRAYSPVATATPPLTLTLTADDPVPIVALAPAPSDGVLEDSIVFALRLVGGTWIDGTVRAQATADNAADNAVDAATNLAADVEAALNDALRNAGLAPRVAVDSDGDGRLTFAVTGGDVEIDFSDTPTRRLQYSASGPLTLSFESPQVIATYTGGRIALTALPSLEQPDTGRSPLVLDRRVGVTIADFTNSAYTELGLLSSPVPFNGQLTDEATFRIVVDGVSHEITVAPDITNTSIGDLLDDINTALGDEFEDGEVRVRRVALTDEAATENNRFEFHTSADSGIRRIELPRLAVPDPGETNAAIDQLGFSTTADSSARVQTAEFFLRDTALDGRVTLSADGLEGTALVGFGGDDGLGIGVTFTGSGSVVGAVNFALVNPDVAPGDPNADRVTLEQIWNRIGNPLALEPRALVNAEVTGVVDVDLEALPAVLLGGRALELEPITVSLDLDLADWLDAPPALDDADAPNGIAVSVSGLDLSIYDTLSSLSFSDVVGALDDVLEFLVQLQGEDGALAAILDRPLPLLNQSPSELLVIADHFATLVDEVSANPARSLQRLEETLENLLGLPEEFVTLSFDMEDGLALRVDLVFNASVDASFGFDLDLFDLVALTADDPPSPARTALEGLTNFVGVSSTGNLDVGVGGLVRLSFGIGLGQGNGGAEALGFRDGDDGVPAPAAAPTETVLTASGDAQAAADRLADQDVVFRLNVGGTTMDVTVTASEETREPLVVEADTLLSDLDDAPEFDEDEDDLRVRLANGSVLEVDLDLGAAATVADLVAALDGQAGLAAEFDEASRQIVLTDETESSAESQTGVYVSLTGVAEYSELTFSLQVGHNAAVVPVFVAAGPDVDRPTWLRRIEEAIRQALVDAGEINPVSEAIVAVAYNRIAQGGLLTFQGTKDGIGDRLTIQRGGVFAIEDIGDADVGTALGFIRRSADSATDSDGEIRSRSLRTSEPAETGGLVADVQRAINAALALARVQNPGLPDVDVGLAPPAVANTGMGRLTLSTALGTTLEITSLEAEELVPFLYNGEDGTSIRIDAHATGENLDFTAQVGPFGFYVVDGTAELSAFFAVILVDDTAAGDDDGRTYFGDAYDIETDYGGSATASLPLFFPDESTPVNDVDNVLTIGVPNLRSFLGEDTGDGEFDRTTGSVTIFAPDLTAFPTPTLIGMLSNPEFLIDGLDSILSSVQDALDGEIFGVELPLIGDGLAPAGQFIGDFRDDVLGYLSLKLRQGGLNPVTLVQETLYNIFAGESDGDRGAVEVLGFDAGAEGVGVLEAGTVLTSGALARAAELNVTVGRDDPVRVVVRAEDVVDDTPQALVDALNDSLRGRGLDDELTAGFVSVAGGFRLTLTAASPTARIVVDAAGAIPLDLFGLRVGALGLLNDLDPEVDGDDDEAVDIDDILRSGFGLFDDFGQFDFVLGDRYVFNQPLDFELGLPILEFDLDAGVQLALGWDFAFGFGVSQEDGFYFVTDSTLLEGDEELVVSVDVNLLGVLGYAPGAAGVADDAADRTVLTAAAELPSDGRLSRDLTFSLDVDGQLVDVTVTASVTNGHTTRGQLAASVEAAIDAALVTAGLAPSRVTAALHRDAAGDETGLLELTAGGAATTLRIFDSATARGQLGFLALDATDGGHGDGDPRTRQYTHLGLHLGIDLRDPGDGVNDDNRLSFAEISSSSTALGDILVAGASGTADVNLGLVVSFDAFGLDASLLPAIGTDLVIHWTFGFSTDTDFEISPPDVLFDNITLDLGSFITDFAGPFLSELADVLAPLDFLLDRNTGLLYQRLPVISDLAGETVTLMRLAELLDTENRVTPFIQAVEQVYFLASLVSDAAAEARAAMAAGDTSMVLDFGSISLLAADLRNAGSLANTTPTTTLPSNPADVFNRSASTTPHTQNFTRTIMRPSVGGGVSFDILQPTAIVDLLLGKPDVPLISYNLPSFGFDFEYLQRFPIYPPLFATLRGAFSATVDLGFGYDTLGLNQFRSSGNPLDLVNGFFVNDLRNGVDIPEVTLDGTIAAGASLDAGVASAGVEGGINALIFFNLNDPNVDGRVRLGEMLGNILINSYNPIAVFDTSGRFDAFLRAYIEVLFGLWSAEYEIGRVTLASFDIPFNRAPLLASDIGNGVLELNVGTAAAHRLHGSLLDGDDNISARYDAGSVYVGSGSLPEQRFTGISKIIVNGGAGNDTIDLTGLAGSGIEIEIHGGAGNDTLRGASGSANRIFGDEGNDRIFGGGVDDELDGGEGNDTIEGRAGGDTIRGGGGNDLLSGNEGDDELDGGAGDDTLEGGAGDDVYAFDTNWGQDRVVDDTTTLAGGAGRDTWDFGRVTTDIAFGLGGDLELASIENVEVLPGGELRVTATRHGLRTGDHIEFAGIELADGTTLRGAGTVTVEAGQLDTFIVQAGVSGDAVPVAGRGALRLERAALTIAEIGSAEEDEEDPDAAIQIETAVRHGLVSGDEVRLGGIVAGRAVVDARTYVVTVVDARRFNLDDTTFVGSTLSGTFVQREVEGSGLIERIDVAGDVVTIFSAGHGLAVNDEISIFGLDDADPNANGKYRVASIDTVDGLWFTLDPIARDGARLAALDDGTLDGGVGVWQRNSTQATSLGSTATHNGYGIEVIRGGRGGDRFDTYQTGDEQVVLDGQGGSDTYVAHAINARVGAGASSNVRLMDSGDFWDTDRALFLGSQGTDTLAVDQTTVATRLAVSGDDSRFDYGEPDVVLGIESGAASEQGVVRAQTALTTGNLERAARLLVTIGTDDPMLVVVEPESVGDGTAVELVSALQAAIDATPLVGRLLASAVADDGNENEDAFLIVLTATSSSDVFIVDNVSAGSGIEAFELDAAGGDDAIAVASTNARTSVRVVAGLGDDLVTVGGPADANALAVTLRGIRGSALTGPLLVDGQEGLDRLLVTDVGNLAGNSGTLNDRAVSGLGMQVDIEYRGVEQLGVQLGQGADAFVVERTIAGATAVAAGGGADTVTVRNVFGTLDVLGEQGADALTLHASAAGSVARLSGGAGDDAVHVRTIGGNVEVSGGADNDTIEIGTGAGIPPAAIAAGPGAAKSAVAAAIPGDVNLIKGALSISGGAGLDSLSIDDSTDGGDTLTAAAPLASGVAATGRLRGDAHFSLAIDGGAPVNVVVAAEPGTLGAVNAVPAVVAGNGRLSAEASFVLVLAGDQIEIVVEQDTSNGSIGDLLDDLNAALDFAGIDAARVSASYDGASGRFSFASKQGETLEIRVNDSNTAATELGFAHGTQAVFDNDSSADLVADVNAALRQAGVGERVVASVTLDRLALTLRGGTLRVNVAADDPAASDLGLVDGQLLQPHNTGTLVVNQATGRAELTGLGMGALGDGAPGITYDSIDRVSIALGSGNDVFNVRGTLNDEPGLSLTTIDMGAGDDVILVSDLAPAVDPVRGHLDGTLDAIDGELIVRAGAGANALVISDRASQVADPDVVVTASRIVGLAPAPIGYEGTFPDGIDIFAGAGGDRIRIESLSAGYVTSLYANAGDDEITVADANVAILDGLLIAHGEQGADRLDAGAWNTGAILFGDLGEVDFGGAAPSVATLAFAQTIETGIGGDDVLVGGSADDALFGGRGADAVSGGLGDDALLGDFGRVRFVAGQVAQAEATELFSGANDQLAGGAMTLAAPGGGDGHDILIGGAGHDLLFGTLAEDVMIFEYGRITLVGGRATSVVVLGQSPLDLAASTMFGLYVKPLVDVPEYVVAPRVAAERPLPESSIVVSTGHRAMVASHHQQVAQTVELPGVEFELGSQNLTPLAGTVLEQIGMVLADFPGAVIEVAGHTDATGSTEFNQALSQQRAEAVRDALIEQGVDPARLRAVGYGEGRPIADNETDEGRARNRRVELTLSENPESEAPDAATPLDPAVIGVLGLQGWRSRQGMRAQDRAPRRRIDW